MSVMVTAAAFVLIMVMVVMAAPAFLAFTVVVPAAALVLIMVMVVMAAPAAAPFAMVVMMSAPGNGNRCEGLFALGVVKPDLPERDPEVIVGDYAKAVHRLHDTEAPDHQGGSRLLHKLDRAMHMEHFLRSRANRVHSALVIHEQVVHFERAHPLDLDFI